VTLFDPIEGSAGAAASPPPLAGGTTRVRMTVAYDGSGFRGFAANAGVTTVGGTLTEALERVLGHQVELTCAGRTDAGVHGWGQVVSFDARADGLDLAELQRSVNRLCGGAIVVREAGVAAPDFDARFSARARVYRYTILNRPVGDPFLVRTAWHVTAPLDVPVLRLACDPFIGSHDFSSFCRAPKVGAGQGPASLVRRVVDARWDEVDDGLLQFQIEANAFCHQMVRSIVGTLVEVGSGRRSAGDLTAVLRSGDRQGAGQLAPPHGLCLWEVKY
jgi:tRNA pseudouridine38-40 synthase